MPRLWRARGLTVPEDDTWPQLVDELLSKHVEPTLIEPTFLMDYPVELSPFAKRHRSVEGLVERFEAYIGGIEIANAFTELNDPDEQRRRFEEQRALAGAGDEETQPYDEAFVEAFEQGMPPDRRDRDRHRPPGDGDHREALDPRGRAVPRDAGLAPASRTQEEVSVRVGILLFDQVDLLDVGGPYEVFLTASRLVVRDGGAPPFRRVDGRREAGPVAAYGGLALTPHGPLSKCGALDVFVVPGAVDIDAVVADGESDGCGGRRSRPRGVE